MAVSPELKFTNGESFRLFTTGLEALQAYEREAREETLRKAEANLEQCVRNYPNDVLPLFYLGVVRILQGDAGLDKAIELFHKLLNQGVKELEPAARFHVAWAHLERYSPEDFAIAEKLLNDILADLEKEKPPAQTTNLRLQAQAMLTFIHVRQNLWIHRAEGNSLKTEVAQARQELKEFKAELDRSDLPTAAKDDLEVEFSNTSGILLWFQGCTAPDQAVKARCAQEALHHFGQALGCKVNWLPALQNQARVYMELLNSDDEAEKILWKTLEVHPGAEYSYYLLGKIYEKKDKAKAIEYYSKAPGNPKAKEALDRLQSSSTRASSAEPTTSP